MLTVRRRDRQTILVLLLLLLSFFCSGSSSSSYYYFYSLTMLTHILLHTRDYAFQRKLFLKLGGLSYAAALQRLEQDLPQKSLSGTSPSTHLDPSYRMRDAQLVSVLLNFA